MNTIKKSQIIEADKLATIYAGELRGKGHTPRQTDAVTPEENFAVTIKNEPHNIMSKHSEKIHQMINEARDAALKRADELERSGAMDESAPHYAKAIATAALIDSAQINRPITNEGRADLKNLAHF